MSSDMASLVLLSLLFFIIAPSVGLLAAKIFLKVKRSIGFKKDDFE